MTSDRPRDKQAASHALQPLKQSLLNLLAWVLTGTGEGGSGGWHLGKRRELRRTAVLAPNNRRRIAILTALPILGILAFFALLLTGEEELPSNNAIWLDKSWVYAELDTARIADLRVQMQAQQIGSAYTYVSTLGAGQRWSGHPEQGGEFMQAREQVTQFVRAFKREPDDLRLFAWLEIWAVSPGEAGSLLSDSGAHQYIADFARLMVNEMGFDGILLDIKPIFRDDDDFVRVLSRVRASIGTDKTLAVAIQADLTPPDPLLEALPGLAPGTMWSPNFKLRVLQAADEVILPLYQSYRQDARDYINWAAVNIEAAVSQLDENTALLASIPQYGPASAAHNPQVETIALALDGVHAGLQRLSAEQRHRLSGVAIFSDAPLSAEAWQAYRTGWLER